MKKNTHGFTIVELLVVIAVMGVLAVIGIVGFESVQQNARNAQRSSRISLVSEALEKYFNKNGEYPSCAAMTATPSTVVTNTLIGLDPNTLTAPTAAKGTNSFLCTDPTSDTYAYVVTGSGAEFTLKYKEEGTNSILTVDSRHRLAAASYTLTLVAGTGGTVSGGGSYSGGTIQTMTATPGSYYSFASWTGSTGCSGLATHSITMDSNKTCTANFTPTPIAAPVAPTVTNSTAGSTTTWSWGAVSCGTNSTRYQYRYTISPAGYDSGWVGPQAGTSVAFTTSTGSQDYTVAIQAQCYNAATNSDWGPQGSSSVTIYTMTTIDTYGHGTITGGGVYRSGQTATITVTPDPLYYFAGWYSAESSPECTGGATINITMNSDKQCTAFIYATPIATPAAPTVNNSYSAPNVTWTWNNTCGGNSARYARRWTLYDPGPPAAIGYSYPSEDDYTTTTTASWSRALAGGAGDYNTLHVRTQCYNAATQSNWSDTTSSTYIHP